MTQLQEKLMELMDEIDFTCKKLGLRYILAKKTAERAERVGAFIGDEFEFNIQMPLYDAMKLREYTEQNLGHKRVIESWSNNGSLKRLMFRYVDRGSLFIDESKGEHYKYPGIAVSIYLARSKRLSDRITGCERYLMMMNQSGETPLVSWRELNQKRKYLNFFGEEKAARKFQEKDIPEQLKDREGFHIGGRKYEKWGKDRLAAWVEKKNEESADKSDKEFWYMNLRGTWDLLPEGLFDDIRMISFEGRSLPVTEHTEEYMTIAVGKKWRSSCLKEPASAEKKKIIIECDLPFEEYLEFTKDDEVSLEEIMFMRRDYNGWKKKYHTPLYKKVKADFRLVRCSQVRIDMWHSLKPHMDELQIAYDNNDVDTLARILDSYLNNTDKFYSDKVGFYINDTLLDYADMVWQSMGKTDYRSKVYARIPKKWKEKNLDAYLEQY